MRLGDAKVHMFCVCVMMAMTSDFFDYHVSHDSAWQRVGSGRCCDGVEMCLTRCEGGRPERYGADSSSSYPAYGEHVNHAIICASVLVPMRVFVRRMLNIV